MKCLTTQGYYGNVTSVYKDSGLKGHGAKDIYCGYGSPIESPLDGYVYKIINDKQPAYDGTGYWGIFIISEYKGQVGELCVGHCSDINVFEGDFVTKGQTIGKEGNKGKVFEGGVEITKKMQDSGDIRGSHRHWQWRPVTKTKQFNPKAPKLLSYGYKIFNDSEGYFYEINDFYNGYNGLSPEIEDILSGENTTIPIQKSFIEILRSYVDLLKMILRKR